MPAQYPNMRLGQAFWYVMIADNGAADPELFYECNNNKALQIIWTKYLTE